MKRIFTPLILICALAGLLWPKVSVALIDMGIVKAQFYVICTGEGVETIAVNGAGDEIDLDHEVKPCVLSHGLADMPTMVFPAVPTAYALADFPRPAEAEGQLSDFSTPFARAPPRV